MLVCLNVGKNSKVSNRKRRYLKLLPRLLTNMGKLP